jgi:IS30 family transposase
VGSNKIDRDEEIVELIIEYRKKHLSVSDIKARLDSQNIKISEGTIFAIITDAGFIRLSRRNRKERTDSVAGDIRQELAVTPESMTLTFDGKN